MWQLEEANVNHMIVFGSHLVLFLTSLTGELAAIR